MGNLFESDIEDITRLVLVRHGRTAANREARIGCMESVPLDATGVEQVTRAAARLEDLNIDVVYASPLLRTQQTARIICDRLDLPFSEYDELKEFNFGLLGNLTLGDVEVQHPDLYGNVVAWLENGPDNQVPRPHIPEAENITDFARRIRAFCDLILEKHPGQVVAAVTHMAVIKGMMAVLFDVPLERHMNYNAFNSSITIIDFYKKNPVLTAFNDIRHLDEKYRFGRVHLL